MIGQVEELAVEPRLPMEWSSVRCASDVTLHESRSSKRQSGTRFTAGSGNDLADERDADPEGLRVFVAEANELTVCAGWITISVRQSSSALG